MDRYRKISLQIIVIFLLCCFYAHGQNISEPLSDNVFCYLTADKKGREHNRYKLFIYNSSQDSLFIENLNKNIYHISTFEFKRKEKRAFFWNLLTISNKEPENVVTILPIEPSINISSKQIEERNEIIVLPPNELFISDIYMQQSPFVAYPKGYYKLCLFYKKIDKCIAETIIEIK